MVVERGSMARIAIDAMGGDYAPRKIVEGAVWAAMEYGVALELVGREDDIQKELEHIKKVGYILSDCGTKGHKRKICRAIHKTQKRFIYRCISKCSSTREM